MQRIRAYNTIRLALWSHACPISRRQTVLPGIQIFRLTQEIADVRCYRRAGSFISGSGTEIQGADFGVGRPRIGGRYDLQQVNWMNAEFPQ